MKSLILGKLKNTQKEKKESPEVISEAKSVSGVVKHNLEKFRNYELMEMIKRRIQDRIIEEKNKIIKSNYLKEINYYILKYDVQNYDPYEDINNKFYTKKLIVFKLKKMMTLRLNAKWDKLENYFRYNLKPNPRIIVSYYYSPIRLKFEWSHFYNFFNINDYMFNYIKNKDNNFKYQSKEYGDVIFNTKSRTRRRKSHDIGVNSDILINNHLSNVSIRYNDAFLELPKPKMYKWLINTIQLKPKNHPMGQKYIHYMNIYKTEHFMYTEDYNETKDLYPQSNKTFAMISNGMSINKLDKFYKIKNILRTINYYRRAGHVSFESLSNIINSEKARYKFNLMVATLTKSISIYLKVNYQFRQDYPHLWNEYKNYIDKYPNSDYKKIITDRLRWLRIQIEEFFAINKSWFEKYPANVIDMKVEMLKKIYTDAKHEFFEKKKIKIDLSYDQEAQIRVQKLDGWKTAQNSSKLKMNFAIYRDRVYNKSNPRKLHSPDYSHTSKHKLAINQSFDYEKTISKLKDISDEEALTYNHDLKYEILSKKFDIVYNEDNDRNTPQSKNSSNQKKSFVSFNSVKDRNRINSLNRSFNFSRTSTYRDPNLPKQIEYDEKLVRSDLISPINFRNTNQHKYIKFIQKRTN